MYTARLVCFFFASAACLSPLCVAEDEKVDAKEIRQLIDQGDLKAVQAMISKIETQGPTLRGYASYERLRVLCQELAASKELDKARLSMIQDCADILMRKETTPVTELPVEFPKFLYVSQEQVLNVLLALVVRIDTKGPQWKDLRSTVMRHVMLFAHRVHAGYIPDYKQQKWVHNPIPPLGGGDNGCDPNTIKDKKQRAAYVSVLLANLERGWKNEEQNYFRSAMEVLLPEMFEDQIVSAYSRDHPSYCELDAYLQLGGFRPSVRLRLIERVAKSAATQPPAGLIIDLRKRAELKEHERAANETKEER